MDGSKLVVSESCVRAYLCCCCVSFKLLLCSFEFRMYSRTDWELTEGNSCSSDFASLVDNMLYDQLQRGP